MNQRHVLVVHTRMPAFDRDSGSQDIDNTIRFLLDSGWSVTFLAREEEGVAEERHANRLRQMGVATYAGFGWAERILRSNSFDLAIIAFWEPTAALLPLIKEHSPRTRVLVNSMDVHFLRLARLSFGRHAELDGKFAAEAARELNAYNGADAVIAVSDKERDLLRDFLGPNRAFTLPLAERMKRSPFTLDDRRGFYFVGNFRHLPNREAAEYLCREVLPLLDPELLERHPLTLIGNWLHQAKLDIDPLAPGLNVVGWVPSVQPYVERSRLAAVPLLHGAGVKRKVIQSMMAYTPVVTTPVGAESLELVQGQNALIAADAEDMSAGITRLLTEDDLWHRLAAAGADHVDARHGEERMRRKLFDIIDRVMSGPRPAVTVTNGDARRFTGVDDHRSTAAAIRERIRMIGEPGAIVLVASGGDDELVELGSQPCWHFPQGNDGGWAGFEPVDGRSAITHLESLRVRGGRYFVLPKSSFTWRYRFPELIEHLENNHRRVHQDEHLMIYDLAATDELIVLEPTPTARVLVLGTYAADRTGPSPALVTELGMSDRLDVTQRWRSDAEAHTEAMLDDTEPDFVVFVRDDAILPSRFLDELIATQATLDVERLQPAHTSGPASGPPITERHRGTVAREVDQATPLPVLSVRAGASLEGPVTLADNVTVGLRRPVMDADGGDGFAFARRIWVADPDGRPRCYERPEPASSPRISVLISTYNRADLLRECLTSFAGQTLDRSDYEVVVVDDGSEQSAIESVLDEFAGRLQIVGLRIGHAGRSAAKNVCVFLARSPIVLFFDDDDRAAPDLLERHLHAHEAKPGEAVAILGHTHWASEIERTPLMHFITDVARLMFAYERLGHGQELDWRGFWEGRISCKRSLLIRHGLHDQRLNYSIDIEMGWRLAAHGLRIIYDSSARSVMARPVDVEDFCTRTQAKGKAHAIVAALHPGTEVAERLLPNDPAAYWEKHRFGLDGLRQQVTALEVAVATDPSVLPDLHTAYGELFRILHAKGVAEATGGVFAMSDPPTTVHPFENTDPGLVHDGTPAGAPTEALLSVSIPVWSRTPELAKMAQRTIEKVWEIARIPTEVVVIDNGSPYEVPLAAKVYRYPENKGVATGWNTGIRLSTAPVVAVMNSDCLVEPGWDEALYEAATDGRRVAFPYTDHCDGLGFASPDQGGTAGWCFMMTKALYEEVGVFDEWFNPAFCEDTDYWHRAWQLGIELSPVPAARVVHARRTTASTQPHVDWLLQGHRYKYGWKHGVDPHRAPPYYNREITDYHGSFDRPGRRST